MFIFEKTYDIDELMLNNMHTHTKNSLCAKPEMILPDMIKAAEEAGLKTLAITDHSDPRSDIDVLANTLKLKEELKKIETPVRVLIGAETSAYGIGKFADTDELNKALDYRNYSLVHYHLSVWEQPEDRSPRGYAVDMLRSLSALFDAKRADCIAHPFSPNKMKFFSPEEKEIVLSSITDNELGDILEKGEKTGCAWELHQGTVCTFPDFGKRFFNMGKEVGVHFNVGTDAHRLCGISTADFKERLKEILK